MNKKLLQKISLLVSVLGLLYLILSYYEITRYLNLNFYKTDFYIEKYKKLKKQDNSKVIISFLCEKENFPKLKTFINSILDQSYKIDEIILPVKEEDVKYIPEWLLNIVSLQKYTKDYQETAPLICSLLKERETDTKIIIVNPNKIFSIDFVSSIIEASEESKEKIIFSKHAYLIKPDFFNCDILSNSEKNVEIQELLKKFSGKEIETIKLSNIYSSI